MVSMYLYRLGDYIPVGTTPTLPIVSFENSIDLSRLPTYPMDEVERIWKEEKQLTFILHYLDGNDVYYFVLPTHYNDTYYYWNHELGVDQHLKWHHCDFYANRILGRFMERFQRRLYTRMFLSEIHQKIKSELNNVDEMDISYQESLYEILRIMHLDDSHDRHLIQRVREEAQEKVETERRYRPDGEGFLEAQQDFEENIKSLPL